MKNKANNSSLIWPIIIISALLTIFVAADLQAQDNQSTSIFVPRELNAEANIMRFVQSLLEDPIKRQDPFISDSERSVNLASTYQVEEKQRPESGLGKYDVEELTLTGIWDERGSTVATVHAPDGTSFVIRAGDEAYDGRLVEVNHEEHYLKFLQELKRKGGSDGTDGPKTKIVEKIVRFRRK